MILAETGTSEYRSLFTGFMNQNYVSGIRVFVFVIPSLRAEYYFEIFNI